MNQNTSLFIFLINNYLKPLWKWVLLLVFLSLMVTFLTALQPLFVSGLLEIILGGGQHLVDNLPDSPSTQPDSFFNLNTIGFNLKSYFFDESKLLNNNKIEVALIILKYFLIIAILLSIFHYGVNVCTAWIKSNSSRLIRSHIIEHILSLDLKFFQDQKSGELISRFTQDAASISIGIGPLIQGIITQGSLAIIYSFYLFSTNYLLALGTLLFIFLQWIVSAILKKPVRSSEKNVFDKTADLVSTFQEILTNIRVIKSFGAAEHEINKINKDIEASRKSELISASIKSAEPSARLFLDNFAISGIFIIGIIQLQAGQLNPQGFLLFLFVGRLLITPIKNLFTIIVWVQAILASYDRLSEIFKVKNDIKSGDLPIKSFNSNLAIKNISFSYGEVEVLKNVSFELKKGEILGIVGSSGAGKSTLTDLILRLSDPISGAILMDGINLKELKIRDYQKIFGVVPQESLLFNDTIANNISFSSEVFNENDIEAAAKIANSHDFIMRLSNGYQTLVGDRGVKLSGGQRQRIAIARAIYSKPEIVIFDEATSSLDSHSEKQVQIAIEKILSKSTAIIVAHRLSTILHADKIIVLSKGKIEAIGSHQELLARSETYLKLYTLQFNG